MRISDWSSDVCSSDLLRLRGHDRLVIGERGMAEPVEGHNRLDAPREMPRGDERERAEVREHDGGEGNDSRPEELRDFRFQVSEQSKRSEEHTSELQSLMRISYAVFCLKKKNTQPNLKQHTTALK